MSWLHAIWEWLPYISPAFVNALLVFLGIVMSFPQLAEDIENTPKYKYSLAGICIVAGLVGLVFEVYARHDSDKATKQLITDVGVTLTKSNEVLGKTDTLVTNTSTLDTFASKATPALAGLQSEVSDLDRGINAAKEKHDPKMVSELEAKAHDAEAKANAISRELLAITRAPRLADELRDWQDERRAAQDMLHDREYEEEIHYGVQHRDEDMKDIDKGITAIQARYRIEYDKADDESDERLKQLLQTANQIRLDMIQQFQPGWINPHDKLEAQKFEAALKDLNDVDRNDVANYLEELARRVPPPK